jgi:hypothetical protein
MVPAVTHDLSRAIALYLGWGVASVPSADIGRLRDEFGADRADSLGQRVEAVVREVDALPTDWSSESLEAAGERVGGIIRDRHPELTDEAVKALVWHFTWTWQ